MNKHSYEREITDLARIIWLSKRSPNWQTRKDKTASLAKKLTMLTDTRGVDIASLIEREARDLIKQKGYKPATGERNGADRNKDERGEEIANTQEEHGEGKAGG